MDLKYKLRIFNNSLYLKFSYLSPHFCGLKYNNMDNIKINTNNKDTQYDLSSKINDLWVSVSEAAKFGGVQSKTIRRAIQSKFIKYKVVKNRYFIDFASVVAYLHTKTKLKNKFNQFGIGRLVEKWK